MTTEQKENDAGNLEDGMDTSYDYLVKLLLLGDSGVGKTCFLHRYTDDEFKSTFIATVGVDFRLKKLDYEFSEDKSVGATKKKIHLQLWDTAGQERYRSLTKAFFRDGMGFLLLFDLTSERSFKSVREWLNEIKEQAYCEKPDILLIGNKSDLENREVTSAQAKQLAGEVDIPYMETSAMTGENVTEAVNKLLDLVMNRMKAYASNLEATESTNLSSQDQASGQEKKDEKSSCAC